MVRTSVDRIILVRVIWALDPSVFIPGIVFIAESRKVQKNTTEIAALSGLPGIMINTQADSCDLIGAIIPGFPCCPDVLPTQAYRNREIETTMA